MTISAKTFLTKVEAIAAEEPSYREGGSGTDGTCDCIGLIIGAIRRAGGSWRGLRGSNYAARNEVSYLKPIDKASSLKVGEAVFKARAPGDPKYNLHSRYDSSPDRNDYYHVGVVISVDPLRIRHMTTPKPKMDTSLDAWKYHGWLSKIGKDDASGGGDEQMAEKIIIRGGNEQYPIHMRSGPGTDRKILTDIAQGTEGTLLEVVDDKWCKVEAAGRIGYIQTQFIQRTDDTGGSPAGSISVPFADLERIYDTIGNWLGRRG